MPIRLDARLSYIASLVDFGSVADVGCDHGKLGYYLLGTDRADKVIATDISAESLKKARELAEANGADIDVRLGDGLDPLSSGEVGTVIIAGLGGDVIAGILMRAKGKRFPRLILSPNTHPEKARDAAQAFGHRIISDRLVECAGKAYTVIKTKEGEAPPLDEAHRAFGAFYESDALALSKMEEELAYKQRLLEGNPTSAALAAKTKLLKDALSAVK